MVIQHDEMNVTKLINVGLVAIFASIAISYYVSGLYHERDAQYLMEHNIQERIAETKAQKAEQLAAIDPTGEMTLEEAMAAVIEANRR